MVQSTQDLRYFLLNEADIADHRFFYHVAGRIGCRCKLKREIFADLHYFYQILSTYQRKGFYIPHIGISWWDNEEHYHSGQIYSIERMKECEEIYESSRNLDVSAELYQLGSFCCGMTFSMNHGYSDITYLESL